MMSEQEVRRRFGLYIRYIRKQKRITGTELASQLMLSQQQVSRYEKGVSNVSLSMMHRIVKCLDLCWNDCIYPVLETKSPPWL